MLEVFEIPQSLVDKVQQILHETNKTNPEVIYEEEILHEVSPPNPAIEKWIKANKKRFEKEYGSQKGKEVLYGKAWSMYHEEIEMESTEHDKKEVAVAPRHENDSKVILEKGKKRENELDEKEKIIWNPEVYPDRINSDNVDSNKTQRTV